MVRILPAIVRYAARTRFVQSDFHNKPSLIRVVILAASISLFVGILAIRTGRSIVKIRPIDNRVLWPVSAGLLPFRYFLEGLQWVVKRLLAYSYLELI